MRIRFTWDNSSSYPDDWGMGTDTEQAIVSAFNAQKAYIGSKPTIPILIFQLDSWDRLLNLEFMKLCIFKIQHDCADEWDVIVLANIPESYDHEAEQEKEKARKGESNDPQ